MTYLYTLASIAFGLGVVLLIGVAVVLFLGSRMSDFDDSMGGGE